MDDGPYRVILLMYGYHDMRHTDFRRLTVVNGTPRFWGVTARPFNDWEVEEIQNLLQALQDKRILPNQDDLMLMR